MCDVHPSLLMRADKASGERQGGNAFSTAFYFPFKCKCVCERCIFLLCYVSLSAVSVCGQYELNLCLCVATSAENGAELKLQ